MDPRTDWLARMLGASCPTAMTRPGHPARPERPTTRVRLRRERALYLGHGASGTAASMAPFVAGLRARGVEAVAIDLPKRKAEDALPAFHLVVPSASDVAVGGHSYGGRVASLAAAEPGAPYAGLVLFSYPLHPPGAPERTDARISHWPAIACPGPAAVRRSGSVRPDRAPRDRWSDGSRTPSW